MPNWCENSLLITGPKKVLDTIEKKHLAEVDTPYEKYSFDFSTIVPYPEEHKVADAKLSAESGLPNAFSKQGYDWCIGNWGTKWNAASVSFKRHGDQRLVISFDTAWTPPLPVIIELGRLYPTAEFSLIYKEEGMCFKGGLEMVDGKVNKNWQSDYEPNEEGGDAEEDDDYRVLGSEEIY